MEKSSARFPGGSLPIFLYAAFLAGYLFLHLLLEVSLQLCWFKALTGYHCPSCGISRAFFALFSGRPFQALKHNPFMLIFSLGVLFQFFLQALLKRRVTLQATRKQRHTLYIILGILFLLNWLYLLIFVP